MGVSIGFQLGSLRRGSIYRELRVNGRRAPEMGHLFTGALLG